MIRRMTAPASPVSLTPAGRALLCVAVVIAFAPLANAAGAGAGAGAGATEANDRLAAQTLAIFGEKCFGCHTAAAKPKPRKFNYVDDLTKLAGNPKFIVAGDPDKSLLYKQIVEDEMPPEDSDVQPLTPAQRDVVRAWIKAGAPAGRTVPGGLAEPIRLATNPGGTISSNEHKSAAAPPRPTRPFFTRLILWLGKFHPLAAHTPIAVLMAAAIAEMLFLKYRSPALTSAARFCMVLGAMGAILTAALGWAMATGYSGAEREALENHRWAGTAAAILCIPIALLGEWGARRAHRDGRDWHGPSRWLFRVSVFFVAGLVGFAAHIGGIIVWGADMFQFPK